MKNSNFYKKSFTKRGFSLVEMLIYIFILTIILAVVTNSIYSLSKSYRSIRSADTLESSAMSSLDRIVREIHDATSVDSTLSTLGTSPGVLMLNTTDDLGATTTVKFSVSSQAIRVAEAGVDVGPLTDSSTRVTSLIFRLITTSQSKAVKVEMTIESGTSTSYKTKNFYSTAVLRGSYAP